MANTKILNSLFPKGFVFHTLVIINLASFVLSSVHIKLKGPDEQIIGDYEKYTCEMNGEEVTKDYGYEFKFKLKNGNRANIDDLDILTALESRKYDTGYLKVTNFLRIEREDVAGVVCQHSPSDFDDLDVDIKNLTTITADNDPCDQADKTEKPVTSVYLTPMDTVSQPYRQSHYIGEDSVKLTYGSDFSEIKLVCYGPSSHAPEWSFNKELAEKMKFAVYAQNTPQSCKKQVLHIYKIAGEPGHTTELPLKCRADGSTVKINLGFEFPMGRSGNIDFNSTENCINETVEKFYDKELTGVGLGSSFIIILMMVGMGVMKKQLNNQQQQNGNRGPQPTTSNGAGGGASSTEQLNPNENKDTSGTAYP